MANQKLWKRHAEWNVSHGGSHRGEPSQQGGGRLASPCYTGQQNNPVSRVTLDLRWLSLILLCETQPGYHFFFFFIGSLTSQRSLGSVRLTYMIETPA